MMKKMMSIIVPMLVALTVLLTGCETSDNPDTAGVGDYFNENPYSDANIVADPQQDVGGLVYLSAGSTSLASGEKTVVRVTGGDEPYTWGVDTTAYGSIDPTSGKYVTFTASGTAGSTTVFVRDKNGNTARVVINTTTTATTALTVSANATAIDPQQKTIITASGGTEPYSWFVDVTTSGNVNPSSGSSVTFTASSVSGYTSVSVVDASGSVAKVVIQTK